MAIAIESKGQFAELLGILRKRRWQIILPICFGLALAAAVTVVLPKKYLVKTTVELRESRVAEEANSRTVNTPSTNREITNAENHIRHYGRIQGVIEEQGWEDYLLLGRIDQREYVEDVMDDLSVTVPAKRKDTGSTFITVEYLANDPVQGEEFLQALSHRWLEEVVERERTSLQGEVKKLWDLTKSAENSWRSASNEASRLLKEGGLSPSDIFTDRESKIEDPDYQRLVKLENQLTEARGEVSGLDALVVELDDAIAAEPMMVPVDLLQEGLDRTAQIAVAEEGLIKLRQQQDGLTTRNPDYHKLADKIEQAEEQIALLQASQRTAEVVTEMQINQQRVELVDRRDDLELQRAVAIGLVSSLVDEIADKRIKIAEKSDLMEQYYLAIKERELLASAYALANDAHDLRRRDLDAIGAYGLPYEVVQEALAPDKPSQPQPLMIITIGLLAGLALGAGSAILAEFAKDGFRNAAELSRSMSLPILGVVDEIQTRGQLRMRALRRAVVGISSTVVIVGLLAFVWAWTQRPEALPVELQQQLDAIRSALR